MLCLLALCLQRLDHGRGVTEDHSSSRLHLVVTMALGSVGYLVEFLDGGQRGRHGTYSYAESGQTVRRRSYGSQLRGMAEF